MTARAKLRSICELCPRTLQTQTSEYRGYGGNRLSRSHGGGTVSSTTRTKEACLKCSASVARGLRGRFSPSSSICISIISAVPKNASSLEENQVLRRWNMRSFSFDAEFSIAHYPAMDPNSIEASGMNVGSGRSGLLIDVAPSNVPQIISPTWTWILIRVWLSGMWTRSGDWTVPSPSL